MPKRHSLADKANAVVVAERHNSSEVAGKELGIPARTIRRWRDDPLMADIVRKTREETAGDVAAAMVLAWARLIERLQRDEVDTRDLIILAGVATDKAQLLSGGATGRTETRDLTGTLSDADLMAALSAAERIAAGDGIPTPTEGASAGEL